MLFILLKLIFETCTFILSSKILNMIHILYMLVLHNLLLCVGECELEPTVELYLAPVGEILHFPAFV